MCEEERGVLSRAVVYGVHIWGMARVSLPPGFICEGGDEAGTMIALVEGYSYEALAW